MTTTNQPTYRDAYVTANGLKHHYLEWGDPAAPAIVLLHGTTSNAHSWDQVSAALAPRYRVLAIDCRNHGDSEASFDTFSRLALTDDVAAIVDELGLQQFSLIGHSMGGGTAMKYTGLHPDRVEKLAVEDIGPEVGPEGSKKARAFIGSTPAEFDSVDAYIERQKINKKRADDDWLRYQAQFATIPLPNGKLKTKFRPFPPSDPPPPGEMWEHVKQITCPVLLLRGSDSDVLTADIANRMLAAMPTARLVTIPDCWHSLHDDNPKDYIAAVTEFFGVSS